MIDDRIDRGARWAIRLVALESHNEGDIPALTREILDEGCERETLYFLAAAAGHFLRYAAQSSRRNIDQCLGELADVFLREPTAEEIEAAIARYRERRASDGG